ncbi:MAG: hypothetical protein P1P73_08490 [Brevefilum sp.]|nr:hypothetical protein [Brevefilum sp.]MDW7755639.1 hypothetical protein [Brevefilum sp.]
MKNFKQAVLLLLVIASLGVFIIWGMNLAGETFSEGIFVGSLETSLPIFHLAAEFLMAVVTLIGVIGTWQKKPWGNGLTLFGLGMFTYSAINSMGWTILNDPIQSIPMGITLVIVIAAIPLLIRFKE